MFFTIFKQASLNSVRQRNHQFGVGGISQKTKPTLKGCVKCREIQVVSLDSLPCCAEYMGYIPTLIFFLLDWQGGDRNRVEEGNLS